MKKFLFILGLTGCSVCSHAQVDLGKYGQLSGSLESNSIIYVDDKDLPNSVTDTPVSYTHLTLPTNREV